MDKKKIGIIGAGNVGKTIASEIAKNTNNICVLNDVVDSQFIDFEQVKETTQLLKVIKDLPTTYDDGKHYQNTRKHKETCLKNKKKRKKKKRR
tara:strand:+ start:377 stop:655 length:279 start_codon:yes stop_codon:yes gene_type:complete